MIIFVNKKQRNLRYNSKHTVVIIYRKIVLFYFILFYYLCILLEEYQSVPFYIHLLETSMNKGGSCSSRDRFTSLTNDDDLAVCSSSKHRCSHTVLVSRHVINDNIEVNNWNFYMNKKLVCSMCKWYMLSYEIILLPRTSYINMFRRIISIVFSSLSSVLPLPHLRQDVSRVCRYYPPRYQYDLVDDGYFAVTNILY